MLIGIDLDSYWQMCPKQFEKCIKVYKEKEEIEAKKIDAHNYNLGKYISYAYHSPKKYPKRPFLSKAQEPKEMTGEEMERVARSITNRLNNNNAITRSRNTNNS